MIVAITRAVSPRIVDCELTYRDREPIDAARAVRQHDEYERWLEQQGARVVHAEEAPRHPDGVFVEDTAVVLDEVAMIARPGAESRRGETESIARVLQDYRPLRRIEAPATIDGGDVLRVGKTIYVGLSTRTSEDAIEQMRRIVEPHRYRVQPVELRECLHLKSAATAISEHAVVFNPACVDASAFDGLDTIAVAHGEPGAANVLRIGDALLISASFPETRRLLQRRGLRVDTVAYDELEKAEAGVTCCSLVIPR